MRIMTYNIRLGIQQGLDAIARVIEQAGADIVALQEVGSHWSMGPPGDTLRELANTTGLIHFAYAPCIVEETTDGRPARYGHGLLSRWPIVESLVVPLTRHKDEPRALLHTTLQTDAGPLNILSTHLSHLPTDRPTHAEELLQAVHRLEDERMPQIVMGDLNEGPSGTWVETLQQLMADADAVLDRPTFPADHPGMRIDYLFVRYGRWTDCTVLDEPEASDHRPVVATLVRPEAP